MDENRFRPKKKGVIQKQAITVYLDDSNEAFNGWENISIVKSIEALAHQFSFQIPQVFQQRSSDYTLTLGTKVAVFVNSTRVMTGYVESIDVSISGRSKQVSVSGRSLTGDLVDCSVTGALEYSNISLNRFAEQLVKPFKLKVFLSVQPKTIEKVSIKPGETVFEVLDRQARLQGFFWVTTDAGNLRLTKGATGEERFRAKSQIRENINLLTGQIKLDDSERFTHYKVIGQTAGADNYPGIVAAQAQGEARDLGMNRFRPLTFIAEGSVNSQIAKQRAQWEASSRLARNLNVELSVQNWIQEDNKTIWGTNQIVNVHSDTLGISGDFLTKSVTFVRSNDEGTLTRLSLTRRDAFQPTPVIEKSSGAQNSWEGIVARSK